MNKYYYDYSTLENGMKVLTYPKDDVNGVSLTCEIGVGAFDEDMKNNGVSHALEHLVYKGTEHFNTKDKLIEFEDSYAIDVQNGQTGELYTAYSGRGVYTDLENIVFAISEFVNKPLLRQDDWNVEKNVILDELQRKEDQPDFQLYKLMRNARFRDEFSYIRQEAGGTLESVNKLSIEQIIAHRASYYHPENILIIAAGKIDIPMLHEYLLKYFPKHNEHFDETLHSHRDIKNTDDIYSSYFCGSIKRNENRGYMALTFPAFAMKDDLKTRVISSFISSFLTSRDDSYLWRTLREEKGLVYGISSSIMNHRYYGISNLFCSFNPQHIETIISEIFNGLKILKSGNIPQYILKNEIDKRNKRSMLAFDSIDGALDWLLGEIDEEEILFPEDYIKIRNIITLDDVIKTANQIFDWNKMNIGYIGPMDQKDFVKLIEKNRKEL